VLIVADLFVGELSKAVLERSIERVKKILKHTKSESTEKNVFGQTPLHLAVGWPPGVSVLIQAMPELMNKRDNHGDIPLTHACHCLHTETVQLLLDADYSLENSDFQYLYKCAMASGSVLMVQCFVNALAKRSRRLYDIAAKSLPASFTDTLLSDRLLDADKSRVCNALDIYNIRVPKVLRASDPVYHFVWSTHRSNPGFSKEIAQLLYEAGFRDVDAVNTRGYTPLMAGLRSTRPCTTDDIEYAVWLIRKGARLDRIPSITKTGQPKYSGAHYVCHRLGYRMPIILRCQLPSFLEGSHPGLTLLATTCTRDFVDECVCSCSSRGCLPVTTLFKNMMQWNGQDQNISAMRNSVIEALSSHEEIRSEHLSWLALAIIRFETFERLEITHACCFTKHPFRGVTLDEFVSRETDEVEDIRDEQRYNLSLLEKLMVEFEAKYLSTRRSLSTFMNTYWASRMKRSLREEKTAKFNDDEMERFRQVGVELETSDDHEITEEWGYNGSDGQESIWETTDEELSQVEGETSGSEAPRS
jgi:hypothetical protein